MIEAYCCALKGPTGRMRFMHFVKATKKAFKRESEIIFMFYSRRLSVLPTMQTVVSTTLARETIALQFTDYKLNRRLIKFQ